MTHAPGPRFRSFAPTNLGLKFRTHPWATAAAMILFDSLDERNEKKQRYVDKIFESLDDITGIDPMKVLPKAKPAG